MVFACVGAVTELADALVSYRQRFGMESDEYPTVATDGGADISAAVDGNLKWDWMRCICHLLHNCVGCGLKAVDKVVSGVVPASEHDMRECRTLQDAKRHAEHFVGHMRKSPKAFTQFKELQAQQVRVENGLDSGQEVMEESDEEGTAWGGFEKGDKLDRVLRLQQSVDVRWNSFYNLIERLLKLRTPACRWMEERGLEYSHPMTTHHW